MNNTTNTTRSGQEIYICSGENLLIFPLVDESQWHSGLRIFLYVVVMIWLFLSVALISDIFMCSIEKITSQTKTVKMPVPGNDGEFKEVQVKVWNDTVANLSLMALGTSAPEILLNVVAIIGQGFKSGQLGPGTIVGSAAFNLFVITAVCITSIPKNESRTIDSMSVYVITSLFNLFAYVWLIITLIAISPDVVEIWEAIITFLMFPMLIAIAYYIDTSPMFSSREDQDAMQRSTAMGVDRSALAILEEEASILQIANTIERKQRIKVDEAADIVAMKMARQQSHSRGWYKVKATRGLTGGSRIQPHESTRFANFVDQLDSIKNITSDCDIPLGPADKAIVEFAKANVSVLQSCGTVSVTVIRYGMLRNTVFARYETCNGTAEAGKDYVPKKDRIIFGPSEQVKKINLQIINDDNWEPDEFFYVQLKVDSNQKADIGKKSITQITILNDDDAGTLAFEKHTYLITDSCGVAKIKVVRTGGASGQVTVSWKATNVVGGDSEFYAKKKGKITFEKAEVEKNININILPHDNGDGNITLDLQLCKPSKGSKLGAIDTAIVTIVSDNKEFSNLVDHVASKARVKLDLLRLNTGDWGDQFKAAMSVNGGDIESATTFDYVMHYFTFTWKVIFAFVPPVSIAGGWPTFVISLATIGAITAVVGDAASHFGCLVGLSDAVTAITFVALGTSMPDTFASRQAAIMEKHADNSVGNINGSNAVNVFLGLGIPWLIASCYWRTKGKEFEVLAGDIAGTVIVFTISAIIAIGILMMRRHLRFFGRAELGGNRVPRYLSASLFILLWLIYIVLSSLQAEGVIMLT